MTTFEQELIRAIENGCPECNRKPVYLTQIVTIAKNYPEGTLGLHRGRFCEVQSLCGKILYDYMGNGWIPELEEVVKGE